MAELDRAVKKRWDGADGTDRGGRRRRGGPRRGAGPRPGRPRGHGASSATPRPCPRTPTRRSGGTGGAPPRCATATPSSPGCATCCATATPTCSAALLDAGATELRFAEGMPDTIEDRDPASRATRTSWRWPAAARPSSGCCARPSLASPGVSLLDGVVVDGLAATDDPSGLRRVTGVHLADGRTVDGDLVVLAGGRRGDVPAWFDGHRRRHGRRGRRGHRHRLLVALLPAHRRGAASRDGPDRRRPRLPEVRGVPGRQRHVLGHPRHPERGRHAPGAHRHPSGSTRRPPPCSRSARGSRPA